MNFLPTLRPAYGRDYKSAKEVEAALNAPKDFSAGGPGGPYIALREVEALLESLHQETFNVRYSKLSLVATFKIVGGRALLCGKEP